MLHIFLHFLIPALLVAMCFRKHWMPAYGFMMSTMLVDLDHLLANPIYDPLRCSIGFHPLHTLYPVIAYGLLCLFKPTRYIGLGLVIHMALDSIDCQVNLGIWFT